MSLPPSEPPDRPAALSVPSPGKAGGSPGSSTLDGLVVDVVVDVANVELVASGRVVAVVLLVLARAVDDVVVCRGSMVVVGALAVVVVAADTTTTPTMPWLRWILQ